MLSFIRFGKISHKTKKNKQMQQNANKKLHSATVWSVKNTQRYKAANISGFVDVSLNLFMKSVQHER
jgi:hypothetical protein